MLSERIVAATPLGNTTVDLATATPFFLSWSYLVIQGDPEAVPILEVMPGTQGTLYQITSAYSDYDCPDYELSYDRGIGVEVRHCLVTLSSDSATPRAIAIKVPQLREYWFFDPPENFITLKPA
jgi:hypothetical protein